MERFGASDCRATISQDGLDGKDPLSPPAPANPASGDNHRLRPPAAGTLRSNLYSRSACLFLAHRLTPSGCFSSPPIRSGMDRPEKRSVAVPDDPLVEILSRVSVKDLYRSKCVSKGWRDIIADPIHRKKLPQTLEGFFFGSAEGYGHYIDLMNRSVPLVDPSSSFLNQLLPGIENLSLLHSCNGLLLFEHSCNPDTFKFVYVVCNPATKQLVVVPPSPLKESKDGHWAGNTTFLMFDPAVSSHFHLIQFWSSFELGVAAVHTFSSQTGAWSDRASEWKAGKEGGEWAQWGKSAGIMCFPGSAVFDNMLHFVVRPFDFFKGSDRRIVAADGKGKTCRIIPWRENFADPILIGQSQGRLFFLTVEAPQMSELSVWVLEEHDTAEWSLKHRWLLQAVNCNCDLNLLMVHFLSCDLEEDFELTAEGTSGGIENFIAQ
ncbi:hypothetical protein EJB05_14698, partial [Eragrostis curvula]